jgi:hypothetical protein
MTDTVTVTLLYDVVCDELVGRALTQEEYDNITAQEIRDAINNTSWGWCVIDIDNDGRFTKEAYDALHAMTVEQLKALIEEHKSVLIRCEQPTFRNVFPVFSKGPRKGYPNFKKEPEVFEDRWYTIEFKEDIVTKEVEKVIFAIKGTAILGPNGYIDTPASYNLIDRIEFVLKQDLGKTFRPIIICCSEELFCCGSGTIGGCDGTICR